MALASKTYEFIIVTAKENEDIIIVVFYDGSQLNLLKEDKKITL